VQLQPAVRRWRAEAVRCVGGWEDVPGEAAGADDVEPLRRGRRPDSEESAARERHLVAVVHPEEDAAAGGPVDVEVQVARAAQEVVVGAATEGDAAEAQARVVAAAPGQSAE